MSIFKPRTTQVIEAPPPAMRTVAIVVRDPAGQPIPRAILHTSPSFAFPPVNRDGYTETQIPVSQSAMSVQVDAEGYTTDVHLEELGVGNHQAIVTLTPIAPPKIDPAAISLAQLARIRGAMWTETLDVPLGPRPGSPDNIAATDFLWNYDDATRLRIVTNLRAKGYTHAAIGPIVDSDGYHGCWTPNNWLARFDDWLDLHEYLWDHGLAPVTFLKPDGWRVERMLAEATALLQQPRAQRLMRIVVPMGWEPDYDFSSYSWAKACRWARQVLPNALVLIHTPANRDAPVGEDANGKDNDNAAGWARIAPHAHGWLTQSSAYERKDAHDDPGKPQNTNFQNWCEQFNPAIDKSLADRFQHGRTGWPTTSAWGDRPLLVYAGEYLAYWTFWQRVPPSEARSWGDAAIASGAAGYLDGGTVAVGSGPVPWQVTS